MVRKVWTVVALASTLALSGCGSNNLFDPTRMLSVVVELAVEPDVVNATSATDRTRSAGLNIIEADVFYRFSEMGTFRMS